MAIETFHRVQCDRCERYAARLSGPRTTLEDTASAELFVSVRAAYRGAEERGWALYPMLCPDCAADVRAGFRRD